MFAYCDNNPVVNCDPTGHCPVHTYYYMPSCPKCNPEVAAVHAERGADWAAYGSLPAKGKPNSSQELYNPDGTIKQKRWYDENGNAKRDRDYNHPGENVTFPHDHEWKDGKRQKEHLEPSEDYYISWESIAGVCLITLCVIGICIVIADDTTGIGALDNALLPPIIGGFNKGLEMVLY